MKPIKYLCIIAFVFLVATTSQPLAADIHVSQPVQVTSDTYYERGQAITYDGTYYWLIYGRSTTCTGSYQSALPDVHDYDVYFKRATTVPGLVAATPSTVMTSSNSYLGECGAAYYGSEVWAFATLDLGASAELYGWYTTDGTSWTQVASIVTGLSTGSAHHDEVSFNGELFVMVRRGDDFYTTHTATPKTGGWSTEVAVGSAGGLAHFFVEGSNLYLAVLKSPAPRENQIWLYSTGTDTWSLVASASSDGWDPTLFKVGSDYVFAQAPYSGDGGGRQWILQWSNSSLGAGFFSGGSKMVSEGRYGTNTWLDMWPIGFTDNGGTTYLFYTSERDVPAAEGTGNIWYLEVDWDVSDAHHTYIQEAIDAAAASDEIHVADGTYEEQLEIDKDLTLGGGGGGGGCIILSPTTLTKYFTTSANNYPIVYIHDADNVSLEDLTIDGDGRGNLNSRFYGVAFRNAGGGIYNCDVIGVRDSPFSGAQHGVGIYSWNDDATPRTIDVHDCDIYDFQKNAMALNSDAGSPITVDVRRNTITGAGATTVTAQNGVQVFCDTGTGTIDDNTITGIAYDNTGNPTPWVATSILNYYAELDITNNTISGSHMGVYVIDGGGEVSGNTLAIEKVGISAYGIAASDPDDAIPAPFGEEAPLGSGHQNLGAPLALLDVDVLGNSLTFSGPDNTATYGIEADGGYGPDDLDVTINYNFVSGFEVGIEIWKCTSSCDTGVFTNVVAHYNDIAGNTLFGMRSNADYIVSDGRYNWWGDVTGPYHATKNPLGTGVPVSDYILFEPWLGSENHASVWPDTFLTNCTTPVTVTFRIDQPGLGEEVRGWDLTFQVDNAVVNVATTPGDFTEGDFLQTIGGTTFFALDKSGGEYTATCAILGGDTGATGSGTLFTVVLTPVAEGTSAITITDFKVRDLDNQPLDSSSADGFIQIDCTEPTMEPIAEAEGECYNTDPVFSNFGFDDDVSLDLAEYKIDAGSWVTIFSAIYVPEWNDDGWTLTDFGGLSEGSHTVYFRVKDEAGNWNGEGVPDSYSWQFIKDTTPPDPPTGFAAAPGHNKVHLTWTNPTGDTSFEGVEIRRVGWTDYPEYGTGSPVVPAPSYPANETEGDFVVQTAAEAYDDDPLTTRDIYYFTAFSYDCAGNYSSYTVGTYDRATSYWLPDIPHMYGPIDGEVNFGDLAQFSNAFGTSEAGAGWNAECDYGPTDDWSSYGIPLPDDAIDFEDLMILSMIYGKVTPAGMDMVPREKVIENLEELIAFEITPIEPGVFSVTIKNRASTLKGVRLLIEADAGGKIERIEPGALFAGSADVFFGTIAGSHGSHEICAAALGAGRPLAGSGEIARLHVGRDGENAVRILLNEIDIRSLDNEKYELAVEEYDAPFIPTATALMQNYPNPFNPATTIMYDVSRAGRVTIQIFDVSGRLISTLVDQNKEAGRYTIHWTGKDRNNASVPSGMYFYRMKAADEILTRKMILLR